MQLPTMQLSFKNSMPANERMHIKDSIQLAKVFRDSFECDTIELNEQFKVIYLNQANHVLGIIHLSKGAISGCITEIRHIISSALLSNATQFAVCHNHPSGNLQPSRPDMELTQKITNATKLMGLTCMDHIILTAESYYSFADNGIL